MTIAAHDWSVLNRLLNQALSLPEIERISWVEGLSGEQAMLKPLLLELLTREDLVETGDFLATLPKVGDGSANVRSDIAQGEVIGPYRLERQLGVGGMGSVWSAERVDGLIKRRVALKLPHLNGAVTELAERMERERNILAALEHPNIARLYDAGIANDGRPYLALEYVEGEPIDAYCRARNIDVRARLGLIMQVAHAIAYAHAHLVIHRDLKPSNILVDAKGCVHLLDFGIAKLIDANSNADAPLTQFADTALTPEYASPEQVRGGQISTASDIYSLGVVTYELLSGARPYKHTNESDALSLAQAIVNIEPTRPSDAAVNRTLQHQLKGDLDTILLKVLKKDPQERYATMAEFADDLERYISGEPVRARPDAFWYRTRKLIGRNKLLVGAMAAVVLALATGLGAALWQAHLARSEARTAGAVEHFLEDIFRANSNAQPNPAKARDTTARELLRTGAKMVDESLKDFSESRLRMLGTLAQMHNDLELWDESVALGRKRVELAKSLYGRDDHRVVGALLDLANALQESQVAECKGVLTEALEILDRRRDRTSAQRANVLIEFASYYQETDLPKALQYTEEAVKILRSHPPSPLMRDAATMRGWMLVLVHRFADAETALTEAIKISQQIQGYLNSDLPHLYFSLSVAQHQRQEFVAAELSLRKGWQIARTLFGEASVETLQGEERLGHFLVESGRVKEGLAYAAHASAATEHLPGGSHYLPLIEEHYGRALLEADHADEAIAHLRRATEALHKDRPGTNGLIYTLETQALASVSTGDIAAVQPLLEEAHKIREQTAERLIYLNGGVIARVALLLAEDRPEDAAIALDAAYLPPGDSDPNSLAAMQISLWRSEVELARAHAGASKEIAAKIHALVTTSPQRSYLKLYEARAALDEGKALRALGNYTSAEILLSDAVDLYGSLFDPSSSPTLADALIARAECLIDLHRLNEARSFEARARAIHAANKELGSQYRKPLAALQARLLSL